MAKLINIRLSSINDKELIDSPIGDKRHINAKHVESVSEYFLDLNPEKTVSRADLTITTGKKTEYFKVKDLDFSTVVEELTDSSNGLKKSLSTSVYQFPNENTLRKVGKTVDMSIPVNRLVMLYDYPDGQEDKSIAVITSINNESNWEEYVIDGASEDIANNINS